MKVQTISIIIPTLNEAENVKRLIHFFAEVRENHLSKVIIADSPDSTDMLRDTLTSENTEYHRTKGRGRAIQMNEGAALAGGDILVFLHADVIPPDSFIQDIMKAIRDGYVFGFFSYRFEPSIFMLKVNESFTQRAGWLAGGGDQIQFMTRTMYDQLNGYNEDFCVMEDFELIRRVRKLNLPYKIIQNPATVSARKYHQNSWLKVNLVNLAAFILFKFSIKPITIKSFYSRYIKLA
ncbi:MAG: glycosyltransferase family 2 protein [Saprospiraceae bacterium]|nr:glycosyltransferase family 2 protein [Saprospiraceae bacterium]